MYKKLIALTIAFSLIFPAAIFAAPNSSSSSSPSTSSRSGSFSNSPSRPSAPSVAPKPVPAPAPRPPAPSQSVTGSTSGTFSGSSSTKPNVPTAPNPTNKSTTTAPTPSNNKSSTYNSGFSKPTVQVTNGSRTNPYSGTAYRGGGAYYDAPPAGVHVSSFGTHAAMFAAGTMLGTMMHPWGGYYGIPGGVGVVQQPFSVIYLLVDLLVIVFIAGVVVYIIRRYRD